MKTIPGTTQSLIIMEDPLPVYRSPFRDGAPIAAKLTMERALQIIEESKNWPLPWTAEWKMFMQEGQSKQPNVEAVGL